MRVGGPRSRTCCRCCCRQGCEIRSHDRPHRGNATGGCSECRSRRDNGSTHSKRSPRPTGSRWQAVESAYCRSCIYRSAGRARGCPRLDSAPAFCPTNPYPPLRELERRACRRRLWLQSLKRHGDQECSTRSCWLILPIGSVCACSWLVWRLIHAKRVAGPTTIQAKGDQRIRIRDGHLSRPNRRGGYAAKIVRIATDPLWH